MTRPAPADPVTAAATWPWWGDPLGESLWPLELAGLVVDRVWRGCGVPRGDGRPVLLVPGFLSGDPSLLLLHHWLRSTGHRTYRSHIAWNVDCSERAVQRLERHLAAAAERGGSRVTVIGHSRGGLFAVALARRRPDLVARVVALGSPLRDQFDCSVLTTAAVSGARFVHHVLDPTGSRQGCLTLQCRCRFTTDLASDAEPPPPLTSIYSRDDGIVRPASCRVPGAENIEVRGSHLGLAVNATVYRHLADILAGPGLPQLSPAAE